MPAVVRFLALRKGKPDRGNQADIFVNGDPQGQHICLGLSVVEFLDAELKVAEGLEGRG